MKNETESADLKRTVVFPSLSADANEVKTNVRSSGSPCKIA